MHSIQLNLGPLSGMVHCTMSLKERHPARITVVIQAREPGADVRHECSHHHNDCRQHVDVGGRLGKKKGRSWESVKIQFFHFS